MSAKRILVTGFGPFPGVPHNPTTDIAKSLDGTCVGEYQVAGRVLDVCFETIQNQVHVAIDDCHPDVMILLGVHGKSDRIALEGRALNLADSKRPDSRGVFKSDGQRLCEDLPFNTELSSTVDRKSLVKVLETAGFPAVCSEDAGRYLCNAAFFHALRRCSASEFAVPCVFAHLPVIGKPLGGAFDSREWSHVLLQEGILLLLNNVNKFAIPSKQGASDAV
mmetsp:Transcript_18270/g.34784  ORF Transcript_18270/g.34784 Transcript_18270/m.34784 type:complete len:221 (-) Transcript_18270:73-735(-)